MYSKSCSLFISSTHQVKFISFTHSFFDHLISLNAHSPEESNQSKQPSSGFLIEGIDQQQEYTNADGAADN